MIFKPGDLILDHGESIDLIVDDETVFCCYLRLDSGESFCRLDHVTRNIDAYYKDIDITKISK